MLSCWLCQDSCSDSEEDGPGVKKLDGEDWRIKKGGIKKGGHTTPMRNVSPRPKRAKELQLEQAESFNFDSSWHTSAGT